MPIGRRGERRVPSSLGRNGKQNVHAMRRDRRAAAGNATRAPGTSVAYRFGMPTLLLLAWIAYGAATAMACPVCLTDTGAQVRAGIAAGFAGNVLVTVAPFVVLAVLVRIVAAVVGVDPPSRRQRSTTYPGEGT